MSDPHHPLNRHAIQALVVLIVVATVVAFYFNGCGMQPATREKIVQVPVPTAPAPDPAPPAPPAPVPSPGPPPDCDDVTTFDELQPVLAQNCVGCHAGFGTYAGALQGFDKKLDRVHRDVNTAGHMPAGRPSLSEQQLGLFQGWAAGGYLAPGACTAHNPPPTPPHIVRDFSTVEEQIFADAASLPAVDQVKVAYLVAPNGTDFAQQKLAAAKAANSVSVETRDLVQLVNVAPGVWRVDADKLGIQAAEWKLLEDSSQLQFESFTARGLSLKQITKKRLPWLPVAEFNDTVLRNAKVYYAITQVPATFQQLTAQLGVDFAKDLKDNTAYLLAFNGSSLSPAANRLIACFESRDGFFCTTADTGAIVSDQQNVFKNPLLADAGGKANLKFAAGEQLYSLPNGLLAGFLADAAGKRLDFADPAVVHDPTTNPISPFIRNFISCGRCHPGGLVPATDEVRSRLSSSGLGADDAQRVLALYKTQPAWDALFAANNARVAAAQRALGLDPAAADPVALVSDGFLSDQKLQKIADLLLLSVEDLRTCINISAEGQAQAGQLLTGGTVSHDQLVQVLPQLRKDCRLFQDPLSQ